MADADAAAAESEAALRAATEDKRDHVEKLVAAKKLPEALQEALSDPPVEAKDAEIKKMACKTMLKVVAASKETEIDALLGGIDQQGEDTLMKYLYANMEDAEECAKLLKWHEKLVQRSGLGCVVRALTDRKSVMKQATGTSGAASYSDATRS